MSMSKQSFTITVLVIVIAVLGLLVLTSRSSSTDQTNRQPVSTTSSDQANSGITRTIDVLHQYQADGQHVVVGRTTVPTPCHQLSTETRLQESDPQKVILHFSTSKQNDDVVCAQQIQQVRFQLTFNAEENAEIVGGSFDDDSVRLNVREVGPQENLEDFQIYTKG